MPDNNSPITNDVANSSAGFDPGQSQASTGQQLISGDWLNGENTWQYGNQSGDKSQMVTAFKGGDSSAPFTYTAPAKDQNFIYANPGAFTDPNAKAIYRTLAQGFNNSTDAAPQAYNTSLGSLMMMQAPQLNTAADNALQSGQVSNINALNNMAQGNGPSVAAATADQARQANINGTMAMLGSQRGASNPALGLRQAAQAKAGADQQAAAQAVIGRTQEEMNAQNAVAQALGTARGQAQSTASTQATLGQGAGLANQSQYNTGALQQGTMNQQTTMQNLNTALQQGQINKQQYDQMVQAYLQQNQTDISNNVAYQQILKDEQLGNEQIATGKQMAQQAQDTGLAGAGVSALASMGAMAAMASDRRLKKNIKSGQASIRDMLESMYGVV